MNKGAQQTFKLSFGMSQMAATHKNDTISNALAALADKIQKYGERFDPSLHLNPIEKKLLTYYKTHRDRI